MCVLKPLVALAIFSGPLTAPVQRAEAGDNRQGLRMPLPRTHYVNKHRRHRRYIYMAPVTRQPARSAPIEARPKPSRPRIIARSSNSLGRVYDAAGMAWFDGKARCWTGTQTWAFKNSTWYYGGSRWYQKADGDWRSDIADPPAPVACQTIPAFASRVPARQGAAPRADFRGAVFEKAEPVTTKKPDSPAAKSVTSATPPDRPSECRKYIPSIGEVMPVPCEG